MADRALVSVRGEAHVETDPDIATVEVTVTSRSKNRSEALAVLSRRRDEVTSLLAHHGTAIEKVAEGSTEVRPAFKDDRGKERIAGYFGTSRFTITVGDFVVLNDVVTALAREAATSVSGPFWGLRPDSPARARARILAAQNALIRAREYADAFDTRVVDLVELADPGLLSQPSDGSARRSSALAMSASRDDDEPSFTFTPAAQTVRAVVDARFTIEAPDLSS